MTIQELAELNDLKEKTIRTGAANIPGASTDGKEIVIPEGSRWFFDIHRFKLDDRHKKIDALLAATSKYRYVDARMLKLTENSFQTMIKELLNAGLLQPNGSENPYGANRYDTTMKYDQIKDKESKERIKFIVNALAEAAGKAAGSVISSIL